MVTQRRRKRADVAQPIQKESPEAAKYASQAGLLDTAQDIVKAVAGDQKKDRRKFSDIGSAVNKMRNSDAGIDDKDRYKRSSVVEWLDGLTYEDVAERYEGSPGFTSSQFEAWKEDLKEKGSISGVFKLDEGAKKAFMARVNDGQGGIAVWEKGKAKTVDLDHWSKTWIGRPVSTFMTDAEMTAAQGVMKKTTMHRILDRNTSPSGIPSLKGVNRDLDVLRKQGVFDKNETAETRRRLYKTVMGYTKMQKSMQLMEQNMMLKGEALSDDKIMRGMMADVSSIMSGTSDTSEFAEVSPSNWKLRMKSDAVRREVDRDIDRSVWGTHERKGIDASGRPVKGRITLPTGLPGFRRFTDAAYKEAAKRYRTEQKEDFGQLTPERRREAVAGYTGGLEARDAAVYLRMSRALGMRPEALARELVASPGERTGTVESALRRLPNRPSAWWGLDKDGVNMMRERYGLDKLTGKPPPKKGGMFDWIAPLWKGLTGGTEKETIKKEGDDNVGGKQSR